MPAIGIERPHLKAARADSGLRRRGDGRGIGGPGKEGDAKGREREKEEKLQEFQLGF